MTIVGWGQLALFLVVLTALAPPLGAYVGAVFRRPHSAPEQDWAAYGRSALVFSAACLAVAYVTLRTQALHPLNPGSFPPQPWDVAFNTSVSFVSNTSWQFYAGETTLSTFSQMVAIGGQSFLSAAVGLATGMAVIRGFTSRSGAGLGNFYVDLRRALVFVLLPLGAIGAALLLVGGVPQSIDLPVATQASIKTLGSVGGGFFNVNSAMPWENAGALSNFVQMLLIVLVPAALTHTFGRASGRRRQGWMLYGVMVVLFVAAFAVLYAAESGPTPAMHAAGIEGVNMEGKEQRFGIAGTALYATSTTAGASGAVNGAMESLSGLGGMVPLSLMFTGELIFGGIGSGLAGMLLVVLLAVFVGGLMVGRTPQYLGKRIEAREMKLAVSGTLIAPLVVLGLTALAVATAYGRVSIYDSGPQGFSESLYAYVSQTMNNGSAFAGYTGFVQPADAPAFGISFANVMGGLAMLFGRYAPMLFALAVAGALAGKHVSPSGGGTLRTDGVTFGALLAFVIVVVVLLNFAPALLLGPGGQALSDQLY
jgi:K+-transporting ATPase ATPase A chain